VINKIIHTKTLPSIEEIKAETIQKEKEYREKKYELDKSIYMNCLDQNLV
jgi:hypothetical protein